MTLSPPNENPAIKISQMRVDYESFTAVEGLDLNIGAGEVFGLIGPNGAGKTSTFKVLATLLEPTYGEVYLGGIDIAEQPGEARRLLGYMQDLAPVPTDLKVWEFLDCFAHAYGLPRKQRKARVDECLELVDLTEKRNAYCKSLSRGMTQRLVLAKCLLHSPKVLLLDEPASGMDPVSRVRLRDTIHMLAEQNVAVLISSHILSELSNICSHIGILNHGQLLDHGPTSDVVRRMSLEANFRLIRLKVLEADEKLGEFLDQHDDVLDLEVNASTVSFKYSGSPEDQAQLLKEMVLQEFAIYSFEERETNIEDIILGLDEASKPPRATTAS